MITKIGIVAGDVWHILDSKTRVVLEDLINEVDAPREIVLMSIGWLAREGHVVLKGEAPNHEVSLRKK